MKAKFIYETINFERKQDKMSSLNIGQRKLIEDWLKQMDIYDYVINDNLTIDSDYFINLTNRHLIKFPDYIQFDYVKGFDCSHNKLISLKGCPKWVGGLFDCNRNNLTSLEFCPKHVGGDFRCYNNSKEFTENEVRKLCDVRELIWHKNI